MSQIFESEVDWSAMLGDVQKYGTASAKVLKDKGARILVNEITQSLVRNSSVEGTTYHPGFYGQSNLLRLIDDFEANLNRYPEILAAITGSTTISFNDRELVIYGKTQETGGIKIHQDNWKPFVGLIGIFSLNGNADFFTYKDARGFRQNTYKVQPGSLVIIRPEVYHSVAITNGPRYAYVCRKVGAAGQHLN